MDFKPPPVPRTQLIRSQTAAEVIHHKVIEYFIGQHDPAPLSPVKQYISLVSP